MDTARRAIADDAELSTENASAESRTTPTNADALVAMAHTVLAHDPSPAEGTETHQVVVHVEAEAGTAHLERTGAAISIDTVVRLACDASILASVERDGDPFHLGRTRREPNRTQRRALRRREAAVGSPAAPSDDGCRPTTSCTGPRTVPPTSTTSCCCA